MTGRHRSPPEPAPPMLARWLPPIAAAAVLLTAASLIALYAPGIAPDATAAGRHGLTVSTAARSARTVHVPLTVLPVPVPSIGAEGAWDPDATPNIALSRPVPSKTFAGVTGTGATSEALTADPVATTAPLATQQQPTTLPGATRTWTRTTRTTPPTSPATSAAATSSAPTTTEETTPVTETVEPTPTVTVDVTAEVTVP